MDTYSHVATEALELFRGLPPERQAEIISLLETLASDQSKAAVSAARCGETTQ